MSFLRYREASSQGHASVRVEDKMDGYPFRFRPQMLWPYLPGCPPLHCNCPLGNCGMGSVSTTVFFGFQIVDLASKKLMSNISSDI